MDGSTHSSRAGTVLPIAESSQMKTTVFLSDNSSAEVGYDGSTTAAELLEVHDYISIHDSAYIRDTVAELMGFRETGERAVQRRLVCRKRYFLENEEAIADPMFIRLCYHQAQQDYLEVNFPTPKDLAAHLAALQVVVDFGSLPAHQVEDWQAQVRQRIPLQFRATMEKHDWAKDVLKRHKPLAKLTAEQAMQQALKWFRALPYGGSVFFNVGRIHDPTNSLPERVLMGINERGLKVLELRSSAERDGLAASLAIAEQRLGVSRATEAQLRKEVKGKGKEAQPEHREGVCNELEELRTRNEVRGRERRKHPEEMQQAEMISRRARVLQELERSLVKHEEEVNQLKEAYDKEVVECKKAWNKLEESKGKIRVMARWRPLSGKERDERQRMVLGMTDEFTLQLPSKDGGEPKHFQFDRVFDHNASQTTVFEDIRYLIQSAIDGFNVCIFAYGQTGSGKTHTIHGTDEDLGLTPRAMQEIQSSVIKSADTAGSGETRLNEVMEEAVRRHPRVALLWSDKGRAHKELGQADLAADALHKALALEESPEAYLRVGLQLQSIGDHRDAIKYAHTALKLKLMDIEFNYQEASSLHAVGDYNAAVRRAMYFSFFAWVQIAVAWRGVSHNCQSLSSYGY
ncbi:unnamed protein product [Closterium sp. NIES-65]|nr:unnamed protein product [Closterium sp. NIES-65]